MDKSILYKDVGRRIRKAREDRTLTQDALAKRIFLTRASVTNIEKGRQTISLHKFIEICEALHTSISNLLPSIQASQKIDLEKELPKNLPKSSKERILSIIKSTDNK
jgi:transcriptional regulator with XRE-family HTH domain